VVDDGSTDNTRHVLAQETGIHRAEPATEPGKGAALRAALREPSSWASRTRLPLTRTANTDRGLAGFAAASRLHPDALIIGVRDLKAVGAPQAGDGQPLVNFLVSNRTGLSLAETQLRLSRYPWPPSHRSG